MGKFSLRATAKGFVFHLKAGNGETILVSELYKSKGSCKGGIQSVRSNAPIAAIEDQTVEGFKALKHPKFEIYLDNAGEHRFRLKAKNGQNIGASEGYKSKESCEHGIQSVRENAAEAPIEEEEKKD